MFLLRINIKSKIVLLLFLFFGTKVCTSNNKKEELIRKKIANKTIVHDFKRMWKKPYSFRDNKIFFFHSGATIGSTVSSLYGIRQLLMKKKISPLFISGWTACTAIYLITHYQRRKIWEKELYKRSRKK